MPVSREHLQQLMWRWLPSALFVIVLVSKLVFKAAAWDMVRSLALAIAVAAIMTWANDTPSAKQLNIEYTGYLAVVGAAVVAALMGPTAVAQVTGFAVLIAVQLAGLRRAKGVRV
jgi:hypothetical protein